MINIFGYETTYTQLRARFPSTFGSIIMAIELNLKITYLITYLSQLQSANCVHYLPVTFENKCDVSSIAIDLNVDRQRANTNLGTKKKYQTK